MDGWTGIQEGIREWYGGGGEVGAVAVTVWADVLHSAWQARLLPPTIRLSLYKGKGESDEF